MRERRGGEWVWSFYGRFGAFGCGLRSFWFFGGLKLFVDLEPLFLGGALQLLWGVGGRVLWGSFKRWRVLRLFGGKFKAFFLAFMACCAVLPAFP